MAKSGKIKQGSKKARAAKQEAAGNTPQMVPAPRKPADPTEGTHPKATAFLVDAKGLGWDAVAESDSDGQVRTDVVTATRGGESIRIEWQNGVFIGPCLWTRSDSSQLKLNNASAARRTMASPPPTAEQLAAKKIARARVGGAKAAATVKALPFDPSLMTDEELASALPGRKILWVNRISGAMEAEVVPGLSKVRVTDEPSGRTIHFNGSVARSVLVSSITSISGSIIKSALRKASSDPISASAGDAEPTAEELAVFAADEEDGA